MILLQRSCFDRIHNRVIVAYLDLKSNVSVAVSTPKYFNCVWSEFTLLRITFYGMDS